jgi:two-component system cell cycle response regulator
MVGGPRRDPPVLGGCERERQVAVNFTYSGGCRLTEERETMASPDLTFTPARELERHDLLAALEQASDDPACLVIVALRPDDQFDAEWMLEIDDAVARELAAAVQAVACAHGARSYRLDRLVFAILGPPQLDAGAVVMGIGSGVDHGAACLPVDGIGAAALRAALQRLRSRARRQAGSAERQARNVLLRVLAERRTGSPDGTAPRVADLAVRVGRRLGLSVDELDVIVRAAELQDLGKLLLPDAILHKRSAPTDEEWAQIRRHPLVAERIVGAAPALAAVARLVRSCSERFDGSGYPDRLAGERIPLGARVIAVCVAFDAMTAERPYRAALSRDVAVGELCRCAGHQFDPMVVAAFCAL